jgi:hypothetical protein
MSLSDSKAFQFSTAGAEFVREAKWSFIYRKKDHKYHVSKFLDEDFSADAASLRSLWPRMNAQDRAEFAGAFSRKPKWTSNDTKILETIMADGDDRVWGILGLTLLRHPDRDRVVRFLIERLNDPSIERGGMTLNYLQALGISGDRRAAEAIRPYYDEFRKALEQETKIGVPDDVFFGPIPYHSYFVAAEAMVKTDGSPEYEMEIRKFFNHPNE